MSVTDNILKTIDYAIEKRTKHLMDMDIGGVIEYADDDGVYHVTIEKTSYKIPNASGVAFKRGDQVWIHCPNGDFNKKFIIGSRTGDSKITKNDGGGSYGPGSSITPQDIITNAEIDAMFGIYEQKGGNEWQLL